MRANLKRVFKPTEHGRQVPARARSIFGVMADADARLYLRKRDLPRLIALWPRELADPTPQGSLVILRKLCRALRAERRRGLAGHWSYDLNRHLGLWSAYKAELASLPCVEGERLSSNARVAPERAD